MSNTEEKKDQHHNGASDKKFLSLMAVIVCCTVINIACVFSARCSCDGAERYHQDIGSPVTIKEVHDTVYVEVKAQEEPADSVQQDEEPVILDENGNPMPKTIQE